MDKALKLTTRGRYAVMAMVHLSNSDNGAPVPLIDISKETGISVSYLEQLIAGLRRADLVKSARGPGGGYLISRPIPDIMIAEILIAAEDSTPAKRQAQNEVRINGCEYTHSLWGEIGSMLHIMLKTISLEDVISKRLQSHPTRHKIVQAVS